MKQNFPSKILLKKYPTSFIYFFEENLYSAILWKQVERNVTKIILNVWNENWVSNLWIEYSNNKQLVKVLSTCWEKTLDVLMIIRHVMLSVTMSYIANRDLLHMRYYNQDDTYLLLQTNYTTARGCATLDRWKQTKP